MPSDVGAMHAIGALGAGMRVKLEHRQETDTNTKDSRKNAMEPTSGSKELTHKLCLAGRWMGP